MRRFGFDGSVISSRMVCVLLKQPPQTHKPAHEVDLRRTGAAESVRQHGHALLSERVSSGPATDAARWRRDHRL
jgi:hypothetical protein